MTHGMRHIMAHAMSPAIYSAMTQIYFAAWQKYGSAHEGEKCCEHAIGLDAEAA
jgi:hypothetical protein